MSFPNIRSHDGKSQRIPVQIHMFLASIYHPMEPEEEVLFNSELSSFYDRILRNAEIVSGQDVNANVGVRSKLYGEVLAPHGINNRDNKGRNLLNLLKFKNLRILNSYFIHPNCCTQRSFNNSKSP